MRKTICLLAAALLCAAAFAQDSDLGSWVSVQATGTHGKAYGFLRGEYRANQNLGNTECRFLVLGGGYKVAPWLGADLDYELWDMGGAYYHKAVGVLTGTLRTGSLSSSLREKYELTFKPDGSRSSCLRSRIRTQYSLPGAFRPYLASELFAWSGWQRVLFYVGTEIALSEHSTIDLFYCYHIPNGSVPVSTLGLGYYFNFGF